MDAAYLFANGGIFPSEMIAKSALANLDVVIKEKIAEFNAHRGRRKALNFQLVAHSKTGWRKYGGIYDVAGRIDIETFVDRLSSTVVRTLLRRKPRPTMGAIWIRCKEDYPFTWADDRPTKIILDLRLPRARKI